MRRDVRTLFLFLPYVLLHAVMSKTNPLYIQEEILAVIGLYNNYLLERVPKIDMSASRKKRLLNMVLVNCTTTKEARLKTGLKTHRDQTTPTEKSPKVLLRYLDLGWLKRYGKAGEQRG